MLLALHADATVRYVDLNNPNSTPPYASWSTAATNIQDAIDAAVDGDQILVTNGVYATGGRVVFGSMTNRVVVNKALAVESVNGAGLTVIQGNRAIGTNAVRCVYLTNNASLVGFTLTNGASRNTGDAYKEQSGGGAWCESTNSLLINCCFISNSAAQYGGGVFSGNCGNCMFTLNSATNGGASFGGILSNSMLVTNSAINGGGACSNMLNNCVLLANTAVTFGGGAYGCKLINCAVGWNTNSYLGAGIFGCIAIGCVVSNNTATAGGGAYNSQLTSCLILNNAASYGGAGAFGSTLNHCAIIGNRVGGGFQCNFTNCLICSNSAPAGDWPGVHQGYLKNCTIVGNTNGPAADNCNLSNCIISHNGPFSGSNVNLCTLVNCCVNPKHSGSGNITNDPAYMNLAAGDFRLQSNSPCINAGNNSFVTDSTDLDGNLRIAGGTVDIGAYEFPSPASTLSYAWAQQYGLPTDGSADFTDSDGDGLNNWQEWIAGTTPTNSLSVLKMFSPSNNVPGLKVSWQSVSGKTYFLQRSTNLLAQPAFSSIQSNLTAAASTTVYSDTTATNAGPYFYRVGVQ